MHNLEKYLAALAVCGIVVGSVPKASDDKVDDYAPVSYPIMDNGIVASDPFGEAPEFVVLVKEDKPKAAESKPVVKAASQVVYQQSCVNGVCSVVPVESSLFNNADDGQYVIRDEEEQPEVNIIRNEGQRRVFGQRLFRVFKWLRSPLRGRGLFGFRRNCR